MRHEEKRRVVGSALTLHTWSLFTSLGFRRGSSLGLHRNLFPRYRELGLLPHILLNELPTLRRRLNPGCCSGSWILFRILDSVDCIRDPKQDSGSCSVF